MLVINNGKLRYQVNAERVPTKTKIEGSSK
jgi:hypothetical protein